jgi:TRAP-type C4-dicarboxylate transport system permease small subunit
MAVPIGLIGLGLVFLLAAWDYIRQRRRTKLIGQEVTA